jgi:hypothetical protein
MALWRNKSETAGNKKMAKQLIDKWSRPIFGISSEYKDLHNEEESVVVSPIKENATPKK